MRVRYGVALALALTVTGAGQASAQAYDCPSGGSGTCTVTGVVAWEELVGAQFSRDLSDLTFSGSGGKVTFSEDTTLQATSGSADQRLAVDGGVTATLSVADTKTLKIMENSLSKADALVEGGAIYNKGSLTLSGASVFTKNLSESQKLRGLSYGGSISSDGGSVYVGRIEFIENTARVVESSSAAYGGAFSNRNGDAIFNESAVFRNNSAQAVKQASQANGGAIYNSTGSVNIVGAATFENNTANSMERDGLSRGGAIASLDGAVILKDAARFTGNTATAAGSGKAHGGAIFSTGNPAGVTLEKTAEFFRNEVSGFYALGGAISNWSGSILKIAGVAKFEGNSGTSTVQTGFAGGGALYNYGGAVTLNEKSSFSDNKVVGSGENGRSEGGAVLNTNNGTVTLEKYAQFTGNKAEHTGTLGYSRGGALFNTTVKGKVTLAAGGEFRDNVAVGPMAYGGAIFNSFGGEVSISDAVTFESNTVKSTNAQQGVAYGGAIASLVAGGKVTVTQASTFTDNKALGRTAVGGAIMNNQDSVTLEQFASFSKNIAQSEETNGRANGGAVSNMGLSGVFTLKNGGEFKNNKAIGDSTRGGAIYNQRGKTVISGAVSFKDNEAESKNNSGFGGALYNELGTVEILGEVEFSGNKATSGGGAICSLGGTITLAPETVDKTILFSGNTAGGKANSIYLVSGVSGSTNMDAVLKVEGAGRMDMKSDPMGGQASGGRAVTLVKDGTGTWALGGENVFITDDNADSRTEFLVKRGELAFAADTAGGTTVDLRGLKSAFTLEAPATLSLVGDSHKILVGNGGLNPDTGTGGTITLAAGSTLTYDLDKAGQKTSVLTLRAENVILPTAAGETVTLDIRSFKNVAGTEYWLLDAGVDLTGKLKLTYRGEDITSTQLGESLVGELSDDKKIQKLLVKQRGNRKLTWVGDSNDWNTTIADKWRLPDGTTLTVFVPGDAVEFIPEHTGTVNVNAGGVVVAGMEIKGGTFLFKGGEIVSATGDETNYTPATRKMELSGTADATFEDTVDLNFANGYDIASGAKMTVRGGAIEGKIVNSGTFVFDIGKDKTFLYGNPLTGVGTFGKDGAGTLVLSGDQTGATGSLVLNGGTLGGAFTWGGGLRLGNRGTTVAPGTSDTVGTLSVNRFDTNGKAFTLQVRVTADRSDLLEVRSGTVIVPSGSTLKVVEAIGSGWAAEKIYTVLVARERGQKVVGTFKHLDKAADLPFLILEQVRLGADGKPIVGRGPASAIGLRATYQGPKPGPGPGPDPGPLPPSPWEGMTPNQIATAEAIGTMAPGPVQNAMINASRSEGLRLLDLFSGDGHANVGHMIRHGALELSRTLMNTLSDMAPSVDGMPGGGRLEVASRGPVEVDPATGLRKNHRVWAQVSGVHNTWDGDGNAARSTASGVGVRAGASFGLGDGWFAGGLFRYGYRDFRVSDRLFKADIHSFSAGAYGGKVWDVGTGSLRTTLGGVYTRHGIDSRRTSLGERLKADYGANVFQVVGEAAWRIQATDALMVEPFAGGSWAMGYTEGFSESGGVAGLRGHSQASHTGVSTVGVRMDARVHENAVLKLDLGWEHVYGDIDTNSRMAFLAGSDDFLVRGTPADRDAAVVGVGAEVRLDDTWGLTVMYDGAYGAHTTSHGGRARVTYRW